LALSSMNNTTFNNNNVILRLILGLSFAT